MRAFKANGATIFRSANSTSASESLDGKGGYLRIAHFGGAIVFLKTGIGAQTATNADIPIAPNSIDILKISLDDDTVAVLGQGSGGDTYITRGELC